MILAKTKDLVANEFKGLILGKTEKEIVRKATIVYGSETPLRDLELYRVGEFDEKEGTFEISNEPKKIEWSIYSLPENMEEATEILK